MWGSERMKRYLEEETEWGAAGWEHKVVPAMRAITVDILTSSTATWHPHNGGFELFGFDFMMDKNLDVWLLEVNESPDLRPRTPAKAAACSRMLDGMVELVLATHAQANGDNDRDPHHAGGAYEEGPNLYGFRGSRQVRHLFVDYSTLFTTELIVLLKLFKLFVQLFMHPCGSWRSRHDSYVDARVDTTTYRRKLCAVRSVCNGTV